MNLEAATVLAGAISDAGDSIGIGLAIFAFGYLWANLHNGGK